ncbi:MAG: phosphotransferase [Acidobacteria bacterium]|nr:MAG: phosphotransferase [Acidobacteriota bacterium]REK05650.1 MAG: phosphotransferase [Acidobacteriota bacterium]
MRALLREQHPDLAALPLHEVGSGWDNAVFRLGDEYCLRLPRRAAAAQLVENEQRWLPLLAPLLPLPVPVPLRVGAPAQGYPWAWSVCPWLPGRSAFAAPPLDVSRAATTLGAFLAALHRPAPPEAPHNPMRGVPLMARAEVFARQLAALTATLGEETTRRVERLWTQSLELPPWRAAPAWVHGDLHLFNLLTDPTRDGRLAAVIDFGDLCAGDPATDLAVAWMLFDASDRERLRRTSGCDDATWGRARGWAVAFAVVYLAHAAQDPEIGQLGHRLLGRLLDT